jgi:hypothetical protein
VSATAFIGKHPRPTSSTARALFWPRRLEGLLEDLVLERLPAEQTLELAHPPFQLAHAAGAHDVLIGGHRLEAALLHAALQVESRLGDMPCRRATYDTDMPGCIASSTSRTFSAVDQRRRR